MDPSKDHKLFVGPALPMCAAQQIDRESNRRSRARFDRIEPLAQIKNPVEHRKDVATGPEQRRGQYFRVRG
jgi:hypothetical protein